MDRYPTSEEGLQVLLAAPAGEETKWRGPYIEVLQLDPWSHPFKYRYPSTHKPSGYDIWSTGADGADGGEKENADIGNWK